MHCPPCFWRRCGNKMRTCATGMRTSPICGADSIGKIIPAPEIEYTCATVVSSNRSVALHFSPNSRTGGPFLCVALRVDVRDTRISGLGARGGAIRVPVGCVDVRLFGGRGRRTRFRRAGGPPLSRGRGPCNPLRYCSPRPDGRSCCFGIRRP